MTQANDRLSVAAKKYAELTAQIAQLKAEQARAQNDLISLTKNLRGYDNKDNVGHTIQLNDGRKVEIINKKRITITNPDLLPDTVGKNTTTTINVNLTAKGKKLLENEIYDSMKYKYPDYDYLALCEGTCEDALYATEFSEYLKSIGVSIKTSVEVRVK